MSLYKHTENKSIYFLVPLNKSFDGRPAFMNASDLMFDAIRDDRKNGYDGEDGPAFGIEKARAEEYAAYVAQYAKAENLHCFDTHGMHFFIGAATKPA